MLDPSIITRGAERAQLQQAQNMDALADLGGNLGRMVLGRRINQMQQLKTPGEQQAFANNSMFAPMLNKQIKADNAAKLAAQMAQEKHYADIGKTKSEAGKIGAETGKITTETGIALQDNASSIWSAFLNGGPDAAKAQLENLKNRNLIDPVIYQSELNALTNLPVGAAEQQKYAFGRYKGVQDPKYTLTTEDNVLDNQTSADNNVRDNTTSAENNIRTTSASVYSTDKVAETADKNRAQQQEQFDASLYVQQNKPLDYFTAADGTRYAVYANGMGIPVSNNHGAPIKAQQPSAMNSTVQGAILEADDKLSATTNAITNLKDALKYSAKAYDGFGATQRASVVGNIKDSEEATATAMLNNIVTGNALEMLKATFGSAPTEGERAILLQLQGSANLPRAQREAIYNRAIAMAEARQTSSQQKANNLRSGTYFSQQQGVPYANAGQQNPSGGAKKAQSFFD